MGIQAIDQALGGLAKRLISGVNASAKGAHVCAV